MERISYWLVSVGVVATVMVIVVVTLYATKTEPVTFDTVVLGANQTVLTETLVGENKSASPSWTNLTEGEAFLRVCQLGGMSAYVIFDNRTGEVLEFFVESRESRDASSLVRKPGTAREKTVVDGRKNETIDYRSLPSRDKMFINLSDLREYGLLTGIEVECRWPD